MYHLEPVDITKTSRASRPKDQETIVHYVKPSGVKIHTLCCNMEPVCEYRGTKQRRDVYVEKY